jgi:GNAT superfamily N-acetyltransferase
MTHREATVQDCAVLGEMNHELIRDERHRNPMNVSELSERMRRWLTGGEYTAILFERHSQPVAYVLFRNESESSIYLRQFFVSRTHRRQGVGTEAINILFRTVFPPGVRVSLDVLEQNELGRSFWTAVGFRSYSITLERFNSIARDA